MGTCLFGRRTEVARVCQANRKIPKHYLKRCEHATEKGYAKVSLDALGAFSLITSYRCLLTSPTWFFSLLLQLKPLSFQVWRFLGFIWHSLEIPHTIASESLMSFQHQVPEKYMGDMSHTTRLQSSQSGFCRRCRFAMIAEMGTPITSPLRWFTKVRFSPKNDVMTRPKMASSTVIPSKLRGREKFQLMLLIFRWTLESNYLWQALDVLYIMDYWLFDIQPIYYLLTWHLKSRPWRSTNSSPQFDPNNNPIVVSVLLGGQVGVGLFKLPQTTKRWLRWDDSETAKSVVLRPGLLPDVFLHGS